MNKLGFGFLRLPEKDGGFDWDTVCQMTDRFIEGGGTYFDTCYTYLNGHSEEGIRRCVAERYPRERFRLADKIPGYACKRYEDCQRFFDEELRRCGVERFDVLMLHSLNGDFYAIAQAQDQFRFLREKKAEGLADRIGFSYHDGAALLDRILTEHPEVDVVQLQINYLDWDTAGIESGNCYEVCQKHGKPVIVMEPVKGGTLATLPPEAEAALAALHPDWTPSDWALRFVQSLPGVEVCLSGMNTVAQVERNIRPFAPLTAAETDALLAVREFIARKTAVGCTACGYCRTRCPMHIPIPEVFRMYNELSRYPEDDWKILPSYQSLTGNTGKASECIGCGSCMRRCPQKLDIPGHMKLAASLLEGRS